MVEVGLDLIKLRGWRNDSCHVRAGPLPYLWPGAPVFQVVRAMQYVWRKVGLV